MKTLFIGFIGKWLLRFLYGTSRWNIEGKHQINTMLSEGRSVIIATWHSHVLMTLMGLAGNKYYGLASLHKDAEIISIIGERLGWKFFRGSSTRGGKEVFKKMVDNMLTSNIVIAITPDGPRGPAKIPKPGVIRAAQKTNAVIFPASGQAKKFWKFKSWDTFYVGKPFSQIEYLIGDPLEFSATDDYDSCVKKLKKALDNIEEKVEKRILQ